MRVLLINPLMQPTERENEILSKWPPLGLTYIAALIERKGYKVNILERRIVARSLKQSGNFLQDIDGLTLKRLDEFKPDIVGITATTPLIMDAFHTAKLVKKHNPRTLVVLGGAHPTAEPVYSLKQSPQVDIVVRGEGELPMLEVIAGRGLNEIAGLTYRANGKIVSNSKAKTIENLDNLAFPARHLLDRAFYFSPNTVLIRGHYGVGTNILTARGCPFNCAFCQSSQVRESNYGQHIRFHSPEYVMGEIQHLIDTYHIELLVFAEDIFSLKRQRLLRICELIIARGFNKILKFAVNLRVDAMDDEILRRLKEAGFVRAIYGCESGSQNTLDSMGKRTTVRKNLEALKLTKQAGLSSEANIIIGLPGERQRDIFDTIEFLKSARPDMINRAKLYPIPATRYYVQLLEKGVLVRPQDWNELMDRYSNNSDFTFADIAPAEFNRFKDKMDREIVLPTNYMFRIKANWKKNPVYALQQLILMWLHCSILYMPAPVRLGAKRLAALLQIKSRYVFK